MQTLWPHDWHVHQMHACMAHMLPADQNLRKLTASHFKITQNSNENMPNMVLIVYLNENLRYYNEN